MLDWPVGQGVVSNGTSAFSSLQLCLVLGTLMYVRIKGILPAREQENGASMCHKYPHRHLSCGVAACGVKYGICD